MMYRVVYLRYIWEARPEELWPVYRYQSSVSLRLHPDFERGAFPCFAAPLVRLTDS